MKLIFAFGLTFEMPVLLTLLAKVGIISSTGLKKFRRYAYVGMFVIAAILAPPDVITQTGLALPLIALYEISIIAAKMVEPKPVEVVDVDLHDREIRVELASTPPQGGETDLIHA